MEIENIDNDQLKEQLTKVEQEYSVPFSSRFQLDMLNPHEQVKQLITQMNQRERTCTCIAGIALFLMEKQKEIVDQLANVQCHLNLKEKELNEQNNLNSRMETQLREQETLIKALEKKLNDKSENFSEGQMKYERENKKCEYLQQENESLKQEIYNLQKTAQTQKEYISELQTKIAKKKFKIQTFKQICESKSQPTNQNKEQQFLNQKNEIQLLQQKLSELKEDYEELSLIKENIYKQNQEEQSNNKNLVFQLKEANNEIQQYKRSLEQLQLKNIILQEKNENLKQDLIDQQDLYKQILKEKEMVWDPEFQTPEPRITQIRQSQIFIKTSKDLQSELSELNQFQEYQNNASISALEKERKQQIKFQQENTQQLESQAQPAEKQNQFSIDPESFQRESVNLINKRQNTVQIFPEDSLLSKDSLLSTSTQRQSSKCIFKIEKQLTIEKQENINFLPKKKRKQSQTQKDAVEQHFILLTQSIKINSPYMDAICTVSTSHL